MTELVDRVSMYFDAHVGEVVKPKKIAASLNISTVQASQAVDQLVHRLEPPTGSSRVILQEDGLPDPLNGKERSNRNGLEVPSIKNSPLPSSGRDRHQDEIEKDWGSR